MPNAGSHAQVIGAVFWTGTTLYAITRGWLSTSTFPSGVTLGGRTHPLAGSTNLQYLSLDGNSTAHRYVAGFHHTDTTLTNTSATRRGLCVRFTFAPGPSGTYTKPTNTAVLVDSSPSFASGARATVKLDSTGHFVLTIYRDSDNSGIDYTARDAIPDTTDDYQVEVWNIRTADGSERGHFVLRTIRCSDRVATTYLNFIDARCSMSVGEHMEAAVGETTARGAGFNPQIGPIYFAAEDADDPFGLIRVDRMEPDGIGMTDGYPGNSADVDESGTAVPDTTNTDSKAFNDTGSPVDQLYTLTAPLDIVSADLLTGTVMLSLFGITPLVGLSKGASSYMRGLIADGTNKREAGQDILSLPPLSQYQSQQWIHTKAPDGTDLAFGDLATLEAGVRSLTNSTTNVTHTVAALTVVIPYQKDGETIDRVPNPPLSAYTYRRPRPELFRPLPPATKYIPRVPFVGMFAAAPPPPAGATRRRQGGIY